MHDPRAEGRRWLDQAENDLAFARHAHQGEFFHQVCFVAHQCAEKALKALLYAAGARNVIGHSAAALLTQLTAKHPNLEVLRDVVAELDLYYIPTRYPNGLIEGTPHRAFTRAQAERALQGAERVLHAVQTAFAGDRS
jgi:HEPN domain-containing protein